MRNNDAVTIGDMYGKMLNPLRHTLKESNKNAFGNEPEVVGDGPNADGYNEALDDEKPKKSKKKVVAKKKSKKKDEECSDFVKENRKSIRTMVNNNMSKSVFDKLYNKVLKENFGEEDQDVDALGLDDSTPDSDFGDDDFGDEGEGDEVTFTLPKDVAQQLIDVLQASLGDGEEDFGDEGDDLDFGDEDDDFGDEDDGEFDFEEDEETEGTKPAVDKKKAFQGKDNKVGGHPKPSKGNAKTDVTDETGTKDGAPNFSALQGKNNQVPGSTLKKSTDYFK